MRVERPFEAVESGELCDIELSDMEIQPIEIQPMEALEKQVSSLKKRLNDVLQDRNLIRINPAGTAEINQDHSYVKELSECASKINSYFQKFSTISSFKELKTLKEKVEKLQKAINQERKRSSVYCGKFFQRCPHNTDIPWNIMICFCISSIGITLAAILVDQLAL